MTSKIPVSGELFRKDTIRACSVLVPLEAVTNEGMAGHSIHEKADLFDPEMDSICICLAFAFIVYNAVNTFTGGFLLAATIMAFDARKAIII